MGGGRFMPMLDASAPITIKGRHWGGLRLAYALKESPPETAGDSRA